MYYNKIKKSILSITDFALKFQFALKKDLVQNSTNPKNNTHHCKVNTIFTPLKI